MTATMVAGERIAGRHPAGHWIDVGLDIATAVLDHLLDRPPACDLEQTEATPGKLVAETAILLHALRDDAARRPRVEALAARLLPHATNGAVRTGIAMHPALALDYAAGYLALRAFGTDDALDDLLTSAIADPTTASRERVPHRALEQRWLRSLLDDNRSGVDHDDVEATVLGGELDVLHGTRDDGYAFTHALMYATDFGSTPWRTANARALAAQASSAIARFLDDDDFDLVGELLFTWPLLDLPMPAVARFAYDVLDRAATTVGLLPSAAMSAAAIAAQPPAARTSYTLAVSYHSAYVMALAEHLTGASSHEPTAAVDDPATAATLDALIGVDAGRIPEWRREPIASVPTELLVDVALTRAVRRGDLAGAHSVLIRAVESGIAPTTAMHQTTRLLHRLTRNPDPATREAVGV